MTEPTRLLLTEEQRRALRSEIGHAMLAVQSKHIGLGVEVLMPEIVAALVSLAAFVAHTIVIDRDAFEELCMVTTEFEWEKEPMTSTDWLQ